MPAWWCHGKDATYWAGGRGVAIRFVSSLVPESSRVGLVDCFDGGSTGGRSREVHTQRPRGGPIGTARRASERAATWTRQVSPSATGISSCRGIGRVVALCQGRAVTVTGRGPRVVPGWGKGGPVNVVLSGSGGDGTNGVGCADDSTGYCVWLLVLAR